MDDDVQNSYYDDYTCSVEITKFLVYNFKGGIIHAAINYPWCCHDSSLTYNSGLIFRKLSDDMIPPRRAILGDSAFSARGVNGKTVQCRMSNENASIPNDAVLAAIDLILQRFIPSEQRSADWGTRALKAPFSMLGLPLPALSHKRYRLLSVFIRLLNLRTRMMG